MVINVIITVNILKFFNMIAIYLIKSNLAWCLISFIIKFFILIIITTFTVVDLIVW